MIVENAYINTLIIVIISYLIGSFPSAFLAGKLNKINIMKTGSGNIGGMNTFTSVGKIAGIIVIILDMGKGFLSAYLASKFSNHSIAVPLFAVAAAIIGHNWMIYIGFKGGKGLATLVGGLLYLSPYSILILYFFFVPIFLVITKDVYLGTTSALFTFSFFLWGWEKSFYWCIFGIIVTIVYALKCRDLLKTYYTQNRREIYHVLKKIIKWL